MRPRDPTTTKCQRGPNRRSGAWGTVSFQVMLLVIVQLVSESQTPRLTQRLGLRCGDHRSEVIPFQAKHKRKTCGFSSDMSSLGVVTPMLTTRK